MADETAQMWARLRDRRRRLQDTPLVKGSTGRCDSVSTGLAQFEEQMTAARAVSTVTRPVNLFYALEQAGLAIAAVHAQGEYWFSSHGLKVVDIDARLCDIKVRVDAKQTRGAYGIVSNAVGSQVIESEVSVGALWASLPDLTFMSFPGDYPEVIEIEPDTDSMESPYDLLRRPRRTDKNAILPDKPHHRITAKIVIDKRHKPVEATNEWLQSVLSQYPGARECVLYDEDWPIWGRGDTIPVHISWPNSAEILIRRELSAFLNSLAPCYRYEGQRYLRPSVGRDGNKPPSPLMTWWLLLYVFSMISRYRPGQWNKLLDLDKSEYAAPITYALEEVFSVLPHLILEGLDNKPWLLRKPS